MPERTLGKLRIVVGLALALGIGLLSGCMHGGQLRVGHDIAAPNENAKQPLPPYVIEPPDVLQINVVNLLPKATHPIKPLDIIRVQFPYGTLSPDEMKALTALNLQIDANFSVDLDGTITIGAPYNLVISLSNLTQKQAEDEVANQLKKVANPKLVEKGGVKVRLVQAQGLQVIQGLHLVRPDGTIDLGIYGSTYVTGLTTEQAKLKVEQHLSQYLLDPKIALDVAGYNSKVYYVIYDGAGFGEQVTRLPVTGNETVLDAVAQVNGLPAVACKSLVWISRPSPDGGEGMVIPVDWRAITQRGVAKSNYQMMPGDRLYVKADPLITLNTYIDRFVSPIERVMGGLLLGTSTYRSLRFIGDPNAGSGF